MQLAVPQHHFSEELLLDYSAGNATESLGLPVACHLDLCADCRRRVQDLEIVVGASLAKLLRPATRDLVRERLLAGLPPREPPPPALAEASEQALGPELQALGLPAPLHRYLADASRAHFRLVVPGIREIRLPLSSQPGVIARLVKLRPGLEIPLHDHEGPEYTVVFQGGLEEPDGHFLRGDVCVRDRGVNHVQRVDSGQPCVALVVNHGDLVPRTLKGHLFKLIAGR